MAKRLKLVPTKKGYKVYEGTDIPSKSALLQEALKIALKDPFHAEFIDFIPGRYTLQLHGWFPVGTFKNVDEVYEEMCKIIKEGKDPAKEMEGKYHYDLRILPKGATTWFGLTFFTAPWKGRPDRKVQGCFDEKTEILTEKGWKYFKDLSKEDKVAQVSKDGFLSYVKPLDIIVYENNGELIRIKHRHVDLLVNPSHRLYFSPRYWVYSKDGKRRWNPSNQKRFKILSAAEAFGKVGHFKREIKWKGKKENPDWFEFLGFWFAEGGVYANSRDGYRLQISQKTKIDYARKLLKKQNFSNLKEYENKDKVRVFVIRDKKLALEFKKYKLKGKGKKVIPDYVFKADRKSLQSFLKGYRMGDGTPNKKSSGFTIYTSSKVLRDQLQIIGILAGYSVTISSGISGKGSLIYRLFFAQKKGLYPKVRPKHWSIELYKGKLYSVTVPTGLIIVRRNGIYCISGQSVKGYQVLHPKGQKLKEFLLKHFEATQGERIWERRDVLYWMKVKKLWAKPGERGNPTKNEMAVMLALPGDYFAPCVIHRRELDFYDITFLGKHLNGRYYYRLVQRKLNKNEMTKKQREAGKPVYGLFFYFWKAKKCFPLDLMKKVASGKKKLEPVSLKEAKKMEIEQEMD